MKSDKPSSNVASGSEGEPQWGRVLLCGGTDWTRLGKKGGKKAEEDGSVSTRPDLVEPHILRSLSNIKAVSIHTSCAGCHCVVLDVDGAAWLFGRNDRASLGITDVAEVSENAPIQLTAQELGAPKTTTFVYAACGRNHTLLVGSEGQLWTAGANHMGQCGHAVCNEVTPFKLVNGPKHAGVKERVIKAAAGITFSIVLTESGKVFAFGSEEKGQLGNGKAGEHIVSAGKSAFDIEVEPAERFEVLVKGLEDRKIVQISCGQQHSVALDSEGCVYVWGYNGYCRLGLGNQQDVLIPKLVPQFAGPNELLMGAEIAAGPSNTVVIDKQRMYWMAGKWKNTGDGSDACSYLSSGLIIFVIGSSGQPYSSFRYLPDMMGCKITHAACGGVTHWALAPDDDDTVMTIAFGQGAANSELGYGPNEPKSSTKPIRHQLLIGIDVIQIAAGQNTTFFLAKPNAKLSDLPRHPVDVGSPDFCVVCDQDNGEDDPPLECDKARHLWAPWCIDPPLDAVPDGEWFCPECEEEPGAPIEVGGAKRPKGKRTKVKAADEEEPKAGQKRKASAKSKPAGKFFRSSGPTLSQHVLAASKRRK
ncbi:Protein RCC2 [Grifola frondosa]|uniref:Protein RCC2 n=1 Tax=Grifola frondosa TaxID=5627 RepID=A0A1C7MB41_GRIFR|nr:Protein RCC2 [Grifola frondosa]